MKRCYGKTHSSSRSRINMTALAIDLWDKRCGIALEVAWFSFAQEIVVRTKIIWCIKKYIKEYSCTTIIVGLPYDLLWKKLTQLNKTQKFIQKLKEIFPEKKVVWIDERFTSFEADIFLKESWIYNTRGQKDDISAQIILETYLSRNR